jgi:hypothetical protein
MKFLFSHSRWIVCLFIASAAFVFAGCASPEGENLSERPWNTPQGWENGLPAGMDYQRPH